MKIRGYIGIIRFPPHDNPASESPCLHVVDEEKETHRCQVTCPQASLLLSGK